MQCFATIALSDQKSQLEGPAPQAWSLAQCDVRGAEQSSTSCQISKWAPIVQRSMGRQLLQSASLCSKAQVAREWMSLLYC